MLSKTQQKKLRKEKVRTLYQLAKLHEKQAINHTTLAQIYVALAKRLK